MRELEVCTELAVPAQASQAAFLALPLTPAQLAFRLLFDNEGAFFTAYYQETCGEAACVTPWARDGRVARRTVTFTKRLELPAAITRLLGDISALRVDEAQSFQLPEEARPDKTAPLGALTRPQADAAADGFSLAAGTRVVSSLPAVAAAGLESFTTALRCGVEEAGGGRCRLRSRCQVEARRAYPLTRLIEAQMEKEAGASLRSLHAFAAAYVARCSGDAQPPLPLPLAEAAAGAGAGSDESEAEPEWFDSDRSFDSSAAEAGAPVGAAAEAGLLRALFSLRALASAQRATLVSLEAHALEAASTLQHLRSELECTRAEVRAARARAGLAAALAAAALLAALRRRG